MPSLRELQELFYDAVVRPHGTPPDARVLRLIEPRGVLGAEARLEVYARMYCARLVDTLAEDFPRLAVALGPTRFDALAHAYLARHPSRHPSLRHVGQALAAFVRETAAPDDPPFGADLARLEWARIEAFDACDEAALALDDLHAVPPAAWGTLRFRLGAAVRVLETEWPVHEIWEAEDLDVRRDSWERRAVTLRVWRQGFTVRHAAMDATEREALAGVGGGEPFAALCDRMERTLGADGAAVEAAGLILRWIEDGVLARSSATGGG